MVNIWLPADTHARLLESVPGWTRTHRLLDGATEMHHAAGVRRIACDPSDALALLQVAERVYPESAPLIRIAVRKAGVAPIAYDTAPPAASDLPSQARELYPEADARPLRRLAGVHLLVFSFQILQVLDRVRELVRRVV
jgi:hypothetical protein